MFRRPDRLPGTVRHCYSKYCTSDWQYIVSHTSYYYRSPDIRTLSVLSDTSFRHLPAVEVTSDTAYSVVSRMFQCSHVISQSGIRRCAVEIPSCTMLTDSVKYVKSLFIMSASYVISCRIQMCIFLTHPGSSTRTSC